MNTSLCFDAATGAVMPALWAVSVVALAVILERLWTALRRRGGPASAQRLLACAGSPWREPAAPADAFSRVFAAWRSTNGRRPSVEQAVWLEAGLLERNIWILECAASISPLLGILGTLVGISQSFGGFGSVTSLEPAVVSQGISLALRSTAVGLAVAIAALAFAHLFRRAAEGRTRELEEFAEALLEVAER